MSTPDSPVRSIVHDYARRMAEQADRHAVTLESLLAVLRSRSTDDATARTTAVDVAASALVALRTDTDQQQGFLLEPVVGAFARLRNDLRPLVRFGRLDVQFVEPPATGRALPGDVAHQARAIVRNAVLALLDDGHAQRVRIQWDCDGRNLLIGIRDDGRGGTDVQDDVLRPIAERVSALDGSLTIDSTPGWGSNVAITLPLDPPAAEVDFGALTELTERERQVLALLSGGRRNADIAHELSISLNTVKFHVANLLRKAGVSNRAELVAVTREARAAP